MKKTRHVFKNNAEIPIPKEAYTNRNGGEVRVYLDPDVPRRQSRTMVIGKMASATTMYPNANFRMRYPDLWEEHYGEKGPRHYVRFGAYLAALSAGTETGLYGVLQGVLGPDHANALMDWAVYTIMSRRNSAMTMAEEMSDRLCFSDELHGDSWYSDLFTRGISPEASETFKDGWLQALKERRPDLREAWIAVDGSNSDCDMSGGDLPENGKAKSRRDGPVVGYMYAVDATTGMPLTFDVFRGGTPDTKMLMLMRSRLERNGISVKGAILDRIFCEGPALEAVESLGWNWLVMLKKDTEAHRRMLEKHAKAIRWNLEHLVNERGVFGICGSEKLFRKSEKATPVCLFFDGANGSERSLRLIGKVYEAERDVMRQVRRGELPPVVTGEAAKYLSVVEKDGKWVTERNVDAWQSDLDLKGYYSIASSLAMGAVEMHGTYYLRDACEKAYSTMGSQLGSAVTRVHTDNAIQSRHLATFVAQILRNAITGKCSETGLEPVKMIKEIDGLLMALKGAGEYACVHSESVRQRKLLKAMGLKTADLDAVATEYNRRLEAKAMGLLPSQYRRMPEGRDPDARRPTGREAKKIADIASGKRPAVPEEKPKRKRGRPPGSKNKVKKEADPGKASRKVGKGGPKRKEKGVSPTEPRKRGRPAGSKNKKTLEREAEEQRRAKRKERLARKKAEDAGGKG